MPHLVALECGFTPRQHQAEGQPDQYAPECSVRSIGPPRTGHPEPHPAPHRAGQAIASRPVNGELPEQVEKCQQGKAGESLEPGGFDADQKIDQVDRHDDREREQEADQQFLAASGIFECVVVNRRIRPQMPPDVGGKPEAIKTERNELEKGSTADQPAEFTAVAGKRHRTRQRGRHDGHLIHRSIP